jgi:ketosteroid isomerase-like protein
VTVEEATRLMEKLLAALNRRDRDAWIASFDPDMEAVSGLVTAEGGAPFRGLEGASDWFDNLGEVYESVQARLEQTIVVGDVALQLLRVEYVGKGSGVALAPLVALVSKIRDARYIYVRSHFDVAEGFLEVGRLVASGRPWTTTR